MFIKTEKSPSVRIITGQVRSFRIGRTNEFKMAKTSPAKIQSLEFPLKEKPVMKWLATQMAALLANILIINLATNFIL